jgi:hypothetical protein
MWITQSGHGDIAGGCLIRAKKNLTELSGVFSKSGTQQATVWPKQPVLTYVI